MNIDLKNWNLIKVGQIEDDFEGFDDEMIFELTDGTIYYQSEYKYHYHYAYRPMVGILKLLHQKEWMTMWKYVKQMS